MNPLFSVCLTNYNYQKFLKKCVDSVEAQTFTDWNLGVIDDCSTDNSWDYLRKRSEGNEKIVTCERNDANMGVVYSKNMLISQATGRFCIFLDADDYLYPTCLEDLAKLIQDNPEGKVFQLLERRYFPATSSLFKPSFPEIKTPWDLFPHYPGCSFCVSTEACVISGGFSFDYVSGWEDMDFFVRVIRMFGCIPSKIYGMCYRMKDGSRDSDKRTDLARLSEVCRSVFRDHLEPRVRGLIAYDDLHLFPSDVKDEDSIKRVPHKELRARPERFLFKRV